MFNSMLSPGRAVVDGQATAAPSRLTYNPQPCKED